MLICLPTGGGKTVIFSHISSLGVKRQRRVLVMMHRTELIHQAASKMRTYGMVPDIIQGNSEWYDITGCYVASVQTLSRRDFPEVDLLIIDEAHHATAASYRKIIEEQIRRGGKVLGVTATPVRTNGEGFQDLFEDLVLGPSMSELIAGGYLVPTKVYAAPLGPDSLRSIKKTGGDYNNKQLAEAVSQTIIKGALVEHWKKYAAGKKTVLFAVNVELSRRYVEEYRAAGVPAAHVDGETPADEREEIFRKFRSGEVLVLSNVSIATEGVDIPDCEVVQLARPTQSLSLYLQCVGRGLRPAPGKTHAIVLDHADCTLTHGFAEMDRIWSLHGMPKEERAAIKKKMEEEIKFLTQDGLELEHDSAIEHRTTVELVPLTPEEVAMRNPQLLDPRYREMERLVRMVEARHKTSQASRIPDWVTKEGKPKYQWAFNAFVKSVGIPTLEEIRKFRELAKFHAGWVAHTARSFGYDVTPAFDYSNTMSARVPANMIFHSSSVEV